MGYVEYTPEEDWEDCDDDRNSELIYRINIAIENGALLSLTNPELEAIADMLGANEL